MLFNFATSYEIVPKRFRLGINTYFLRQFTDSKLNGVSAPERAGFIPLSQYDLMKSFGIGDEIGYEGSCNLFRKNQRNLVLKP